jgi:uncharacterized membrane protein
MADLAFHLLERQVEITPLPTGGNYSAAVAEQQPRYRQPGGTCLMRFIYQSGGPGSLLAMILFLALLLLFFVVLPANIAAHAAEGLGLTPVQGILLLVAMVLSRGVEFTVFRSERLVRDVVRPDMPLSAFLRMQGMTPPEEEMFGDELVPQTFAVGVGGLLLPLGMSLVFLGRVAALPGALAWTGAAVALAAVVCFAATTYRPGMAPKLPVFMPPVCAALTAFMLPSQGFTASAAFAAAVLGPVLGSGIAPLLLPRLRARVDAPRVVLGGEGFFWGVFFGCIVAGLVA